MNAAKEELKFEGNGVWKLEVPLSNWKFRKYKWMLTIGIDGHEGFAKISLFRKLQGIFERSAWNTGFI